MMFFKQPKAIDNVPEGNYVVQRKYDGERMQFIDRGNTGTLLNRRGANKNRMFPEFNALAKQLPGKNIIDGEMVVFKSGIDSFKGLAERTHLKYGIPEAVKQSPATYMAFDLLKYKGQDIRQESLKERLKELHTLPQNARFKIVTTYPKAKARQIIANKKAEGVVFKDPASLYTNTKNNDWLKLKQRREADAVVMGYNKGEGKRATSIGSLQLGVWNGKEIVHVGNAGSFKGYTDTEVRQLKHKLDAGKKVFVKVGYLKKGSNGKLVEPKVLGERTDIGIKDTHTSSLADLQSKNSQIYLENREPEEDMAFTFDTEPNKIFIGRDWKTANKWNVDQISHVINHEEMHNILQRLGQSKASEQFDKIEVPIVVTNEGMVINPRTAGIIGRNTFRKGFNEYKLKNQDKSLSDAELLKEYDKLYKDESKNGVLGRLADKNAGKTVGLPYTIVTKEIPERNIYLSNMRALSVPIFHKKDITKMYQEQKESIVPLNESDFGEAAVSRRIIKEHIRTGELPPFLTAPTEEEVIENFGEESAKLLKSIRERDTKKDLQSRDYIYLSKTYDKSKKAPITGTAMHVEFNNPEDIYLDNMKLAESHPIERTADIVAHEEMHNILNKEVGVEASKKYDDITYRIRFGAGVPSVPTQDAIPNLSAISGHRFGKLINKSMKEFGSNNPFVKILNEREKKRAEEQLRRDIKVDRYVAGMDTVNPDEESENSIPDWGDIKSSKRVGIRFENDIGKDSNVKYRSPERGQRVKALAYKIQKLIQPYSSRVTVAGSIRREITPNDIDIVVIPRNKDKIIEQLSKLGYFKAQGEKQIFARIDGVDVDIYFTTPQSYGAELMTRTGPRGGNLGNRTLAKRKGYTLNQYGLYKGDRQIAGRTEKEIYEALGKKYKPPQIRGLGTKAERDYYSKQYDTNEPYKIHLSKYPVPLEALGYLVKKYGRY